MKIKTSELTGDALDWAVWQIEKEINYTPEQTQHMHPWPFSEKWEDGGPIIERERIGFEHRGSPTGWIARHPWKTQDEKGTNLRCSGPTPLIAAMRCFVASKLGDEVDIPDELL